ncbi:MAG: response regulator [SAR324 cluster bacterium]|nr:response regulator [SAR324 cluster bacterium]
MAKILIVDDERSVVEHLRELLTQFDYSSNFITKTNFLFPILDKDPSDLILMDVNMPGTDGVTLLKQLQCHPVYKAIPVIMVTGELNDWLLNECFEAGAVDYINKPVQELVLKARIKAALSVKFEKERSQRLLENILPRNVADELLLYGKTEPQFYPEASIVFTDFCGFTQIASTWDVKDLVKELGRYYDYFDGVMEMYQVEKLKTIGDGYMFAGGIPESNQTHAIDCVLSALEIRNFIRTMREVRKMQQDDVWTIRIGIHSGPVIAGVIGSKKFAYDVWGDTVNVASRMESQGVDGEVNISEATYHKVSSFFQCELREKVEIQGKGTMDSYIVHDPLPTLQQSKGVPNKKFWEAYSGYCVSLPTVQKIIHTKKTGIDVFYLFGKISVKHINELKQVLKPVVSDPSVSKILINVEQVSIIDSQSLGFIISCFNLLQKRQANMSICSINEKLDQLFKLAHLDTVFTIYSSEKDALDALNCSND